ncbi:MAG: MMPL family transporter [Egibacteraceae bacterium]
MLASLARLLIRRRVVVLSTTVVALVVCGVFGGGVTSNLTSGGFVDPNTESSRADELLNRDFAQGNSNLLLLVTAKAGVDDPAVVQAGLALTSELASEARVVDVQSYWTLRAPPLASTDRTQALVLGRVPGDEDEVNQRLAQLAAAYTRSNDLLNVAVGGSAETVRQIGETIESDLVRAERIAFPLTLVLLLAVFGSVVAALLPLTVGAIAVIGTLAVLRLLSGVTDVSIYALNLVTALSLGLAIDYSLFIVSRFREELATGLLVGDAVVRTAQTAGRTVALSGATVAISLAALLIFPQVSMRSFAYAGIVVVGVALVGALVVLPALLALLGPRVDTLRVRRRRAAAEDEARWRRIAQAVMRRPFPIATAVLALLILLGAPFLGVEFGGVDDRVLPADNPARLVAEDLRANFTGNDFSAAAVVLPRPGDLSASAAKIDTYAGELSAVDGVQRVEALTGFYVGGARVAAAGPTSTRFAGSDGTWLSVVPAVEPLSPAAVAMVADLRAVDAPFDGVLIGGPSAAFVDSQQSLLRRVPLAIGLIAAVTFTLLLLMFRSLLVPVKAVALNLLSLTATFGAMVWVFQDGHLSGPLGFTATGTLDLSIPILVFCLAFGVSMDYEVFLLSRIKEEHDRHGDNTAAVAAGLAKTGRIITAAAALLAAVLAAFATSRVTLVKLSAAGLALAVVMDATLVRVGLVPAFMKLAGEANWWLPRLPRRIHERLRISPARGRGHTDEALTPLKPDQGAAGQSVKPGKPRPRLGKIRGPSDDSAQ